MCASSAPPVAGPATTSACAVISSAGDVDQILREDARSSRGTETAGAGSGTRGPDSRCRSRSARRASALPSASAARPARSSVIIVHSRHGILRPKTAAPGASGFGEHRAAADDRRGGHAAEASSRRTVCSSTSTRDGTRRSSCWPSGASIVMSAGGALGQRPAGHAENPRRVHRQQLDERAPA